MRFFINERKWMKIRWFSEEFRSLPTITEDFRKKPKMFRTYIIHISESRVQSPESRVQSSAESSPDFRLCRQYKMQTSDWAICPTMLCVTLTARTTSSCSHSNFSPSCSSINITERARLRIPASVPFLCGKK